MRPRSKIFWKHFWGLNPSNKLQKQSNISANLTNAGQCEWIPKPLHTFPKSSFYIVVLANRKVPQRQRQSLRYFQITWLSLNSALKSSNMSTVATLKTWVVSHRLAGGDQGWGSPPNIVFFYNGVSNNGSYPIVVSINSWGVGEVWWEFWRKGRAACCLVACKRAGGQRQQPATEISSMLCAKFLPL